MSDKGECAICSRIFNYWLDWADEAMPWYVVDEDPDVCQTPGCVESAEALKAGIDPGEDPCEDFYAYACGGWQKQNPIPATESQWNQFNVVDRKLDFQLRGNIYFHTR